MAYRSGKWYRNNEKDIIELLGLKPTPNSGSGWIVKEDGESEDVICQLKSTDAQSIKINKIDLDKLNYNALVSHKLPVFVIQFIQSNEMYLVLKPEQLKEIVQYLNTGIVETTDIPIASEKQIKQTKKQPKIKSSADSRLEFMSENDKKYKPKKRSAR